MKVNQLPQCCDHNNCPVIVNILSHTKLSEYLNHRISIYPLATMLLCYATLRYYAMLLCYAMLCPLATIVPGVQLSRDFHRCPGHTLTAPLTLLRKELLPGPTLFVINYFMSAQHRLVATHRSTTLTVTVVQQLTESLIGPTLPLILVLSILKHFPTITLYLSAYPRISR